MKVLNYLECVVLASCRVVKGLGYSKETEGDRKYLYPYIRTS